MTDHTRCGIWIDTTALNEELQEVVGCGATLKMATYIQQMTAELHKKEKKIGIAFLMGVSKRYNGFSVQLRKKFE